MEAQTAGRGGAAAGAAAAGAVAAIIIVEEGPAPLRTAESTRQAFLSAGVTLTLGILGSSVLPVPYAYSRTGVLLGLITAAVISAANAYTGTIVLRAAGCLNKHTYDALAEAAGGHSWKLLSEVSLVMLLFGTLCGDYALLADLGKISVELLFPEAAPAWLTAGDGRVVMVALALLVVFPLSCLRRIRQLEYAATAGVGLVVVLAGVIVTQCVTAGFPAIHSGELPLASVGVTAELPEAVAVLSFAFYLQPMLLPLLKEMPAGKAGVDLTVRATQLVTTVVAFAVYAVVGVFAAARYGLSTQGDVLVNEWLPGRWDGALDALMVLYLSISMVPMAMTLRYQLDSLLVGEDAPSLPRRQLALTALGLLSSLAVALAWPTAAEKMFAVTGATAVCLVCYVIPVAIHLRLYFREGQLYRRQYRRRVPSFSFSKHQPQQNSPGSPDRGLGAPTAAAAAAATATPSWGEAEEGVDRRWLLDSDQHQRAAADGGSSVVTGAHAPRETAAAALASGGGGLGGWGGGRGGSSADLPPAGASSSLRNSVGHHGTDVSLNNNWLGASSAGPLAADPLPPTPGSPERLGEVVSALRYSAEHQRRHRGSTADFLPPTGPALWDPERGPSQAAAIAVVAGGPVVHRGPGGAGPTAAARFAGTAGSSVKLPSEHGRWQQHTGQQQQQQQRYPSALELQHVGWVPYCGLVALRVVLPVAVAVLGAAFSLSALWLSVAALRPS